MKCQVLFSRKNIISLSSAESAHSVISVKKPQLYEHLYSLVETFIFTHTRGSSC